MKENYYVQPIPNLTDSQACALSMRSDLPDDIKMQVTARMTNIQYQSANPPKDIFLTHHRSDL